MKKYRMDVEVVGYVTVEVEAATLEEAGRLAAEEALAMSIADLSYKTTDTMLTSVEGEE